MKLPVKVSNHILDIMKTDLEYLTKANLMDYSFFITIVSEECGFDPSKSFLDCRCYMSENERYIYYIGIIDYLTEFNKMKKLENTYKSIFNYSVRKTISSVNPVLYSERFFEFMMEKVLCLMDTTKI